MEIKILLFVSLHSKLYKLNDHREAFNVKIALIRKLKISEKNCLALCV